MVWSFIYRNQPETPPHTFNPHHGNTHRANESGHNVAVPEAAGARTGRTRRDNHASAQIAAQEGGAERVRQPPNRAPLRAITRTARGEAGARAR